jgi:predicted RNase H-like HicB family nuclease
MEFQLDSCPMHKPGAGQTAGRIWMDAGRREGRPSQLQAPGEPVYSHHRASRKRCTGGAIGGHGEENQTGDQVMRFLIMLEQTETGFAVQAPDLAIATYGENIETAKRAAGEAIRINLEAYREAGQPAPEPQGVSNHLENPEFRDLLFAYVEVAEPQGRIAAQRSSIPFAHRRLKLVIGDPCATVPGAHGKPSMCLTQVAPRSCGCRRRHRFYSQGPARVFETAG